MPQKKTHDPIYSDALVRLVRAIRYPKHEGRTIDLPAVHEFAKKFGVTPEQVAAEIPFVASDLWLPLHPDDRCFNLMDD